MFICDSNIPCVLWQWGNEASCESLSREGCERMSGKGNSGFPGTAWLRIGWLRFPCPPQQVSVLQQNKPRCSAFHFVLVKINPQKIKNRIFTWIKILLIFVVPWTFCFRENRLINTFKREKKTQFGKDPLLSLTQLRCWPGYELAVPWFLLSCWFLS